MAKPAAAAIATAAIATYAIIAPFLANQALTFPHNDTVFTFSAMVFSFVALVADLVVKIPKASLEISLPDAFPPAIRDFNNLYSASVNSSLALASASISAIIALLFAICSEFVVIRLFNFYAVVLAVVAAVACTSAAVAAFLAFTKFAIPFPATISNGDAIARALERFCTVYKSFSPESRFSSPQILPRLLII
jgi:hypothetical protein